MDFEVKHLICAGLDVHKKTVAAAVCITDPVTLEATYKVKSFSTNNSQIAAMRDWLLSYNVRMSAWNPLVNTGSLFLTSLSRICTLSLHIPSMSKP